ncbi:MAG: RES family NAD+ phosphorylase [Cytophagales bacterium]
MYRISKSLYIEDLQGTGCKYEAGRWHEVGTQILYTSETVALAKLEVLANANRLPIDMFLAYIAIPERHIVDVLPVKDLPSNWNQVPYPNKLAILVKEWKKTGSGIALQVPSIHSPTEKNLLLNPNHPLYGEIKIAKTEPIGFDGRFFR